MRLLAYLTVMFSIPMLLSAQNAGKRGGGSAPMTLTIPGFPDGGQIPVKFSQAAPGAAPGEGTSPAMSWANAPAGTQSFFLHMHDMDVVRNKTTDDQAHWVLWNIPATATGLPEGVPKGSQLADGSFQIAGLAPDEYFVVALDSIEPGEETDRDRLDSWRAAASRVALADGESKTVVVKQKPGQP